MKRLFKKNQVIITTLALMIAIAGYLNYSGKIFGDKKDASKATSSDVANKELLDISQEDMETSGKDIESLDGESADSGDVEGTPGEAVLTNGEASNVVAEAKVSREQVRAQNKETLLEIINNEKLSDAEKKDAIAQMVSMTELSEKESEIETLIAAKGLNEVVVSLSKDGADVVVNNEELTDANRAQIEDIITRKTDITAENIVITPIRSSAKTANAADGTKDAKSGKSSKEK